MKALPLWQPWASLVALEAKRVETRHWQVPATVLGQRVAIHACQTDGELWRCREDPFDEYVPHADQLPLGALLCTVVIARCTLITEEGAAQLKRDNPHEHAFGDYTPGRFAWVLQNVNRLPEPVPFRGSQGIFEVPDHLVGAKPVQGSLL